MSSKYYYGYMMKKNEGSEEMRMIKNKVEKEKEDIWEMVCLHCKHIDDADNFLDCSYGMGVLVCPNCEGYL